VDLRGTQICDRLLALQSIQLARVRRAHTARAGYVEQVLRGERVTQAELRRDVGEVVAAIGRPRVEAARSTAGRAVVAGVAGQHFVVVVVVDVLDPRAGSQLEAFSERLFDLAVQRG